MLSVTATVSKTMNRPSLVQGCDYEIIGIYNSDFRIIDESREPTLFPKSYFVDQEVCPPDHWVFQDYGDGEYAYDVPQLSALGFYEDYADRDIRAVNLFVEFIRHSRL